MSLSPREKILAGVVGASAFVVLNLVLSKSFASKQATLREQVASRRHELHSMQALLSEREQWTKRDAWLTEKQPPLENENSAGVQLLENIRTVAKKCTVTLDHPALAAPSRTPSYRSVPVTFETMSTWPALIDFLQSLQRPEDFVVVESGTISIDSTDQTKMRGVFRIARWYAP